MVETATLYLEAVEGHGEDAPPYVSPTAAAVFDGLGGAGASPLALPDGRTVTNAYAASRVACEAFAWLAEGGPRPGGEQTAWADEDPASLAERFASGLYAELDAFYDGLGRPAPALSSCLVLPTTFAAALTDELDGAVVLTALWAGDSRVYALDADGLHQVSQDDQARPCDYRDLLLMDAPMTNKLNLTQPFHVNARRVELRKPCAVLTCSDGCCMYFANPLQLESRLLCAFGRHEDLPAALDYLRQRYAATAQDDCSLTAQVFADGGYGEFRALVARRFADFKRSYARLWDCDAACREARAARTRAARAAEDADGAAERAWGEAAAALGEAAACPWVYVAGSSDAAAGRGRRPFGAVRHADPAYARAVEAQRSALAINRCLAWAGWGPAAPGEAADPGERPARVGAPVCPPVCAAPFAAHDAVHDLLDQALSCERARAEARGRRDAAVEAAARAEEDLRAAVDAYWGIYRFGYERHFVAPAVRAAPL
jgi:serine/threonine protein phosphatase PrpC